MMMQDNEVADDATSEKPMPAGANQLLAALSGRQKPESDREQMRRVGTGKIILPPIVQQAPRSAGSPVAVVSARRRRGQSGMNNALEKTRRAMRKMVQPWPDDDDEDEEGVSVIKLPGDDRDGEQGDDEHEEEEEEVMQDEYVDTEEAVEAEEQEEEEEERERVQTGRKRRVPPRAADDVGEAPRRRSHQDGKARGGVRWTETQPATDRGARSGRRHRSSGMEPKVQLRRRAPSAGSDGVSSVDTLHL